MSEKLKPCPFCGGEADYMLDEREGYSWVHCYNCASNGPDRDTEAEAIAAWNTRAAYEAEGYFFLPKPKEQLIYVAPLGGEETENGYKYQTGIRILEDAARRWANEIDNEVMRRIIECWNVQSCDKCERGAIPATEENMREHGWVKERTCHIQPHGVLIVGGECTHLRCWSCSECSYGWHVSDNDKQYSYCPNCGAKVVD